VNVILVIGDRPEQAKAFAERLGPVGIEAIPCARDWKLAVRSLTSHTVDLILLHVDDSEDSAQFFTTLRELTDVPVLALGVGNDPHQIIWYLDHGAVDYIPRTTPHRVLAAKIGALRRPQPLLMQERSLVVGPLVIDVDRRSVTRNGERVSLTPIEFRLVEALARNAGRACSHRDLLQAVWGADFEDCAHYLRLYIGYLRQKLEENPRRPRTILTEWGYGYRLVEAQPAEVRLPQQSRRVTRPATYG
jgi:two-component system KDP operon response regulator KdpE